MQKNPDFWSNKFQDSVLKILLSSFGCNFEAKGPNLAANVCTSFQASLTSIISAVKCKVQRENINRLDSYSPRMGRAMGKPS